MYNHWAAAVLFAPVLFLLWIIFVDMRTPIADVRVVDQVNDPEFKLLNLVHQLLPPDIALYRFECDPPNQSHRAPNFQLWQDRLPEDCRVVVLAVSHWTTFDANAVLDLEAAVKKLLDSDSTLVLAGLSRAQFKALDDLGVARLIGTENLCTDLEFAIARALLLSGHPFPHHVPVMSPVSSH
jgi:hypothetical protein